MKIEIGVGFLMVVPETEFEAIWLHNFKPDKVFHKTGVTAPDYIGLKITAQSVIDVNIEKCFYCGFELNTMGGKFCSNCGRKLMSIENNNK